MIRTIRDGHADGVNSMFLWLWLSGEVLMTLHVGIVGGSLPVLCNYIANVLMVGLVGWYKCSTGKS